MWTRINEEIMDVSISYKNGHKYVEFTCSSTVCKENGVIQQFCDTSDRNSMGNMRHHAVTCWGKETVDGSINSDIKSVRKGLSQKKDGSITAMFEDKGKGVITYSNVAMTKSESRYIA